MAIIHVRTNVKYLPLPNQVEAVASNELAPRELTSTAFVLPIFSDGSLLMAQNARRGVEVPGGHIEPGETAIEAAEREALEEAGCKFARIIPLGFLQNTTTGEKPQGYRYPYPVSYQQFFVGLVSETIPYVENDECISPRRFAPDEVSDSVDPYVLAYYLEAVKLLEL